MAILWGKFKEVFGQDVVWFREKEELILGHFIYLSFVFGGLGEQVGELLLSARSVETPEIRNHSLSFPRIHTLLWGKLDTVINRVAQRQNMKRAITEVQLRVVHFL